MDDLTRSPVLGHSWRSSAPKSAGLYGELPPLPARLPTKIPLASRRPHKNAAID